MYLRQTLTVVLILFSILTSAQQRQSITSTTSENCTLASVCVKPCCEGDYLAYDASCKAYFNVFNGRATRIDNFRTFRVRHNREFRFKILNLNRYLHSVSLTANDVHFGNEPPLLFRQLFLGESVDSLIASLAGSKKKSGLHKLASVKLFISQYTVFKKTYDSLRNNQLKALTFCRQELNCGCSEISFSALSNRLSSLKQAYVEAQAEVNEVKTKHEEELVTCAENEKNNAARATLEAEIKKLEGMRKPDQKKIDAKYKELAELPGCDKVEKKGIELKRDEATATAKTLEEIFKIVNSIRDTDLFQLIVFNNNLTADDFEYTSPPIFPRGSRLELAFRVAPTDTALKYVLKPLTRDSLFLDLPVLYKTFISFSSGLFYAGRGKLASDNYGFRPVDEGGVIIDSDTSQYELVNFGQSSSALGFAAFANIGMRLGQSWGAGLSAGVGLTIEENPRPAYLTGISTYWGDRRQFNFTIGCAILRVNRLKRALYPDGATYTPKPDIEYDKRLRAGFFFALTYAVFEPEIERGARSGK